MIGASFNDLASATGIPLPGANGFDRRVEANEPSTNDLNNWGVALEGNYYLGDHTITSLSAYRRFDSSSVLDGDFSRYNAVVQDTDEKFQQVSTELRLASPSGQKLEYLGGLYFYTSQDDTVGFTAIGKDYLDASLLGTLFRHPSPPNPPPPDPDLIGNTDTNDHRTYTYAGFGQATYRFTEQWSLTGGLRLTNERKARKGSQISGCPSVNAGICGPDQYLAESRQVFNASPMISLRYFPLPDAMIYATGARGFKSGGFNQLRTLSAAQTEFDDEVSTNAEIGTKTSWFNRRLTLNGDFFFVARGLHSDDGHVLVHLANSEKDYDEDNAAFRSAEVKSEQRRAAIAFTGVPYGEYAVKVFQDENDDRTLNMGFMGPTESYGFSNNVMGMLGPPSFDRRSSVSWHRS